MVTDGSTGSLKRCMGRNDTVKDFLWATEFASMKSRHGGIYILRHGKIHIY